VNYQIMIGAHQDHGQRAIYLPMSREKLTHGMIVDAWNYMHSPLAISFAPYAARGRACSGSSSFSASSGVNRGRSIYSSL